MTTFDAAFLPPALHQFVVIADTHYMLDPTGQAVEFASRRRQTARTQYALGLLAGLGDLPVIHMGDLVQEFPERPSFAQALDESLAQLSACGVRPRFVPGNHDVGDKPDPTMPAAWVSSPFLDGYQRRVGPSWQSWDAAGLHFVILNSQILNSGLPAESEQRAWLEADLQANPGKRIFLFLHLPPFLHNPAEPGLGHYDNIDEPARSWLLGLLRRHPVELLCAAHVHWAFYNEIPGPPTAHPPTAFHTIPSVAFTRPGFSELFSSPPPPEQGRDDTGKLGFYLVRVMAQGHRLHFIRTGGATGAPDPRPRLLTRTSPDLPASPLGVMLHQPLSRESETPSIWPSFVCQPVRNDYPLLACLELGVRHLLVPAADVMDARQRARLAILRGQGVTVTARLLWRAGAPLPDPAELAGCDGLQIDITGSPLPDDSLAEAVGRWQAAGGGPLTLSCVIPGRAVAGKQHNRAQVGFLPPDVAALEGWLTRHNLRLDRLLCRLEMGEGSGAVGGRLAVWPRSGRIGALDWLVELPAAATGRRMNGAAETLLALTAFPGSRLFVEPFVELDRTMDIAEGLLDRLSNPTPVFHLLRHLNTLLYSHFSGPCALSEQATAAGRLLIAAGGGGEARLFLPEPTAGSAAVWPGFAQSGPGRVYGLMSGRRMETGLPASEEAGSPEAQLWVSPLFGGDGQG